MKTTRCDRTATIVLAITLALQAVLVGAAPSAAAARLRLSAGAGTLDPTFGEGGQVMTDLTSNSSGNALVAMPDGRVVVAGNVVGEMSPAGSNKRYFAVSRHNSDGSLDASFGAGGMVTTAFSAGDVYLNAAVLQEDGMLVAGGDVYGSTISAALARYKLNGSLDTAFGVDGRVVLPGQSCAALALQPDGKIIVAGTRSSEVVWNKSGFGLARLNSDGSLDATFGTGGMVSTFSDTHDFRVEAVIAQPDGKLVVAAATYTSMSDSNTAAARYTPDGSLDPEFGEGGIALLPLPGTNSPFAAALQPDGKLLITGLAFVSTGSDAVLARLNPDGSLNATFGAGGSTTADFGGGDSFRSVSLQQDGSILIAGAVDRKPAAARFHPDGTLDAAYGQGGAAVVQLSSPFEGSGGALTPDGKLVVTGAVDNQLNTNTALIRFDAEGSQDMGYGADGLAITAFGGGFDFAYAVAVQPDGKTVMAGRSTGGYAFVLSLSRYDASGSLDTTFGKDGVALTHIDGKDSVAYALAVQPDGKIIAAGGTNGPAAAYYDFALARYNSDGSLDPAFGSGGTVVTDFAGRGENINAMALQPDGKIVAAGWTFGENIAYAINYDVALARYNSDGSLDPSFGLGGKISADLSTQDLLNALALQPDGKILVAGSVTTGSAETMGSDVLLIRYNADGSYDTSFGSGGIVTADFGQWDGARAIALEADGSILAAGDSDGNAILAKFTADGSLDPTFGGGSVPAGVPARRGRVTVASSGSDSIRAMNLQADGKLVLAGYTAGDFLLARLTPDGLPDAAFGAGGRVVTDFGGSDDAGRAMALQSGSRAIVAGYSNRRSNYDLAAARYWLVEPKIMYLPLVGR